MTTFVRDASLLDCLGVIAGMTSPREVEEIEQCRQIWGYRATPEKIASNLYFGSLTVVAMASEELPGRALTVAGFQHERPGVFRTWMFALDEAWEKHGADLTAHTARGIEEAGKVAHRIEVICSDSRPQVHRWYSRIGLQKETTLRRYMADGSDAALFVRIRSDQ